MGRPRKLHRPKLMQKYTCVECGYGLVYKGYQPVDSSKGFEVRLIGSGARLNWSGEKIIAIWQCERCGTLHTKEAKKLR